MIRRGSKSVRWIETSQSWTKRVCLCCVTPGNRLLVHFPDSSWLIAVQVMTPVCGCIREILHTTKAEKTGAWLLCIPRISFNAFAAGDGMRCLSGLQVWAKLPSRRGCWNPPPFPFWFFLDHRHDERTCRRNKIFYLSSWKCSSWLVFWRALLNNAELVSISTFISEVTLQTVSFLTE